jgi:hypothetical protein
LAGPRHDDANGQGDVSDALAGAIALIAGILVARGAEPTQAQINACSKYLQNRDWVQDRDVAEVRELERCRKLLGPECLPGSPNCVCDKEDETGTGCYKPKPAAFRPWQEIWQCNDIRVTVTMRDPNVIEYDLGGTIWGGSHFAKPLNGPLYFNGRPCLPLRG